MINKFPVEPEEKELDKRLLTSQNSNVRNLNCLENFTDLIKLIKLRFRLLDLKC
jgi:hypothetical protein